MDVASMESDTLTSELGALPQDSVQNLLCKLATVESEREMYKGMAQSLKGDVKVLCRVRPTTNCMESDFMPIRVLSPKQLEVRKPSTRRGPTRSCGTLSDSAQVVFFDHVFGPETTNDEVRDCLKDDISAAIYGHQVCIFAYGATGAGKTHTIEALCRRTIDMIVAEDHIARTRGEALHVRTQMVEVYNENFRDLLAPDTPSSSLKVSASPYDSGTSGAYRSVHLQGGVLYSLSDIAADLKAALHMAKTNRATSATNVHDRSSRSHLIVTLFFSRTCGNNVVSAGKLSLVDLAGSERLKHTDAQTPRMKEGQMINKSLAALGDVLWAQERKLHHIPFRNSKLTHLLQDSLGGQMSRTIMIIAVSSSPVTAPETTASIFFGSRLNNISLAGCSDRLASTAEQSRLRALVEQRSIQQGRLEGEICNLKTENGELRAKLDSRTQNPSQKILDRLKRTTEELKGARARIASLERTMKTQERPMVRTPERPRAKERQDARAQTKRMNKYHSDAGSLRASASDASRAVSSAVTRTAETPTTEMPSAVTPPTTRLDLTASPRQAASPEFRYLAIDTAAAMCESTGKPPSTPLTARAQLTGTGSPRREICPRPMVAWPAHPFVAPSATPRTPFAPVSTPTHFAFAVRHSQSGVASANTSATSSTTYRSIGSPPMLTGFLTARTPRPCTLCTRDDFSASSGRRRSLPATPTPLRNSGTSSKYAVNHISLQDAAKITVGCRDNTSEPRIVAGPNDLVGPLLHIKPIRFNQLNGFADNTSQISQSSDGSDIKNRLKDSLPPKPTVSLTPFGVKVRQLP